MALISPIFVVQFCHTSMLAEVTKWVDQYNAMENVSAFKLFDGLKENIFLVSVIFPSLGVKELLCFLLTYMTTYVLVVFVISQKKERTSVFYLSKGICSCMQMPGLPALPCLKSFKD